jgi:hypothetical protein
MPALKTIERGLNARHVHPAHALDKKHRVGNVCPRRKFAPRLFEIPRCRH